MWCLYEWEVLSCLKSRETVGMCRRLSCMVHGISCLVSGYLWHTAMNEVCFVCLQNAGERHASKRYEMIESRWYCVYM